MALFGGHVCGSVLARSRHSMRMAGAVQCIKCRHTSVGSDPPFFGIKG